MEEGSKKNRRRTTLDAKGKQKSERPEGTYESQKIFEVFASSSPIGLYIVQRGKFQYVNPSFEKILGYTKEELIGTNSLSYVHPDDREIVILHAERLVSNGNDTAIYPHEYRVISKFGDTKWIMDIVAPIQYEGRWATLGNFMDITQQRKLEEEKIHFLNFLSIAAHDLKAPLMAIQGYLWLLLKGFTGSVNEKQKNILERSSIRITELMTLVSDLLDIPRIEKGQIIPEMKEIAIGDLARQVVDELQNQASEKGLNLHVNVVASTLNVCGSPVRLKQVMTNLINNAIAYTLSGAIDVIVSGQNNNVIFEVKDTGIGIPRDEIPKIFDDFFRASNTSIKGTGLGLSISRRIIEAHGGKICVESPCENGLGSRFTFSIPAITM